jgi:phage anti-repressor protein
MSHQEIVDLNEHLIRCQANYDIIDYIKRINNLNKQPLDISFMEELLSFIEQDTCCIPHTLLIKYGVFKERNASANVKSTLELYEFIENEDFLLRNVSEQDKKHGGSNKITYYLHPNTFKILLMRSKCEKKYVRYYILLEKCIKYYHDYQIQYKEYIISQKDDKIDTLIKKVDNQSIEINEMKQININQTKQIEELLQNSRETNEKLDNVEEELVTTSNNLETTMSDLSIVQDKLDIAVEDRAVKPYDKNKVNQIAILKNIETDDVYYITCGQKGSIDRAIKLRHKTHIKIDTIELVPNSIYLFDHIKKQLGPKIKTVSRSIQLIDISESDFIDEIKSLFDGRKSIDLSKKP